MPLINVTSDARDGYYAATQRHDLSCIVDIRLLTFTVSSKAGQMGDANHAMSSTCFVLDVKRFLLDARLYLFIFADSRSPPGFFNITNRCPGWQRAPYWVSRFYSQLAVGLRFSFPL